jgi:hypothetical protein
MIVTDKLIYKNVYPDVLYGIRVFIDLNRMLTYNKSRI